MALSSARLRKLLDYNPETGVFTWLVNRGNNRCAGKIAGTIRKDGHRQIGIDGRYYLTGPLAWLWMTGMWRFWPSEQIDHINGKRDDDRIANLRLATGTQNQGNRRGTNQQGLKGITFQKGRFVAGIKMNGRNVYLGSFDTAKEAHAAYLAAARKHFGAEFVKSY